MSLSATKLFPGQVSRLTTDNFTCCHTETEQGDYHFYLRRSHYTDICPTNREILFVIVMMALTAIK